MLKNMKVKKSLLLGYAVTIFVSLAIIITSLLLMMNQRNQYDLLFEEDVQVNMHILYARVNAIMAGRNIRDALLVPDSEANDGLISTAEQCLDEMENYLVMMEEAYPYQLETTLLKAYQDAARSWASNAPMLIEYYESYRRTGDESYLDLAKDFIYETDTPLQDAMAEAATALDNYLTQGMEDERESIANSIMVTIVIVIVALVVAVILVIALAMVLIKSITTPVSEVHKAIQGFSQGQFDIAINYESTNELGEMCKAMKASQDILKSVVAEVGVLMTEMAKGNYDVRIKDDALYVGGLAPMRDGIREMNHNMSDTLTQINLSAEQVSAGSEQVSTGAQALAQGATEQASAVEELSATIQEISTSSQDNAKRSADALEKTNYASSQLDESAENMEEMVRAMNKISDSSQEISKIIATIENIAFQTNILALNAAVEAARAGSAGKGFAVVAEEVRNLATKSDQAAKATKDLIDNSIASVQDGSHIVDRVSESLKRTVDATEELKKAINSIAKAVEEEAESIAQVTEGIDQISSVVQTNSATSEESAATSEELSSQANMMKMLMSKFKLRGVDDDFRAPVKALAAPSYDHGGQEGSPASAFTKY